MRQSVADERHEEIRSARLLAVRVTRVYVDAELTPGESIELPAQSASHLAKVLRARSGDDLVLFNGDGREFGGVIEAIRGARVVALIAGALAVDRESPFAATLIQSVPRGDRMDFVVQKATELGVARIVPVLSQRSVVRLDARQSESKTAHWRAVAINACEQCGRTRLPVIDTVQPLLNYLGASTAEGLKLVLDPEAATGVERTPAGTAHVAIGPEGGFTADELEAFRVAGFARVTLGPRILRTETAALAALVWLQVRFGDM